MYNFSKNTFCALLLSLFFLSAGCYYNNPSLAPSKPLELNWELEQLRDIATICGVSSPQASQMNMQELLTDIKIKLNNTESYTGDVFSPNDLNKISGLLFGEDQILKILAEYSLFIKKIEGQQIVILSN